MKRKVSSTTTKNKSYFLNAPIIESANHKTVIVLDRSPKFATLIPSADISISVRDDQNSPINGKLNKILWNCTTESIMEFHRVVGDLFPDGKKQLRFATSDFVGKFLTEPWSESYVSKEKLINALKGCEPPQASGDATSCSIFNGILIALEAISELSPIQLKARNEFRSYLEQKEREQPETIRRKQNVAELVKQTDSLETLTLSASDESGATVPRTGSSCSQEEGEIRETTTTKVDTVTSVKKDIKKNKPKTKVKANFNIRNKGTIVLFTSIESISDFESITEYVHEQILARNEVVRTSPDKKIVRICRVDLFILNIIATDANAPNANLSREKRRPFFNSRLISVSAGTNLIPGVHKLLQDIYDLVSTTVVGIPMKEETHQGHSVNYDVEMLHSRATHSMIKSFGLLEPNNSKLLDDPSKHGNFFSSVRLKWCTPTAKLKSEMFPLLKNAYTITPAHVHNRASVCLTTYLQSGRNVMLEIANEAYHNQNPFLESNLKDKLISHYLSKDTNGLLVIHCVGIGENANLCGKLFSERIYGENNCFSDSTAKLNCKAMTLFVKSNQIQPSLLQEDEELEDKDYRELEYKIAETSYGMPIQMRDSFIFNISEKFEPLLSLIQKTELNTEQFEQCRVKIQTLITERNSEESGLLAENNFECQLFQSGTTENSTKEEQFKIAFEELSNLLLRISTLSPLHAQIYNMFTEASGIQPQARNIISTRKRVFIEDNSPSNEKQEEKEQMEASIMKRKAQLATLWKPNEEINVYDWWHARYEKEHWTNWKGDFEGRKKFGDKAQEQLYPNLKLPPGQSKGAGTGTAGPIE